MGYYEDKIKKDQAKKGVNLKTTAAKAAVGNDIAKKLNKEKGIVANPKLQPKKK